MADNRKRSRKTSEDEELEYAYRSVTGYKGKYTVKKDKRSHTGLIVGILIAVFAIVLSLTAVYLFMLNAELNGVILHNISVAGIDVGGMTQQEAITAVEKIASKDYKQTPMVIKVLDSQIEIPTDYVGSLDIRGAVKAAYKFGQSGSSAKQQQEQQIAMTTGYDVDLTPYLSVNEAAIRKLINDLGANYNTTLSQTTYEVTGDAPNQILQIHLGTAEYGLDLNALYRLTMENYSKRVFQTEGQCSMIEPEPFDIASVHEEFYKAPTDAYYDKEKREIVSGINGYGFDLDAAKEQISTAKYGSTVEIKISEIAPKITASNIEGMLYRDTLGTYTGTSKSDKNRDVNLMLACKAINEKILYPGEMFSYNETLGERTTKRGYKPGPSYSGNKTVMTVGGGICQVSSALYYCALQGEMDILVRRNHGFMPVYMPVGLDATVSWGTIDFRFENTSDYPVKIIATADGGSVTVTLLGTDLRDYRVELESEILSETPYETTYQVMTADNTDGYKDGDYIVEPYTGYEAKTYLCKYKNDELLSKDLIAKSTYRKRDAIICKIEE